MGWVVKYHKGRILINLSVKVRLQRFCIYLWLSHVQKLNLFYSDRTQLNHLVLCQSAALFQALF